MGNERVDVVRPVNGLRHEVRLLRGADAAAITEARTAIALVAERREPGTRRRQLVHDRPGKELIAA